MRQFFKLISLGLPLLGAPVLGWAAAGADPVQIPDFLFASPSASVREAAEAENIEIRGIPAPSGLPSPEPGDAITILVTLKKEESVRQWLIRLQVASSSPAERGQAGAGAMTLFSSTGTAFNYSGANVPIAIRILGPFPGADSRHTGRAAAPERSARVFVNSQYLSLGFDRACAAFLRIRSAMADQGIAPGSVRLSGGAAPPSAESARENLDALRKVGVTSDDEKAFLGTVPALYEFFHVARKTPGLREIMLSVIDLPLWQLVSHPGKMPDVLFDFQPGFRAVDPKPWGLPETAGAYAFAFVLDLDRKPSLCCQLAVTAPQPPLTASAGIVGLSARRPDGTGPLLMMQVLSAGRAGR